MKSEQQEQQKRERQARVLAMLNAGRDVPTIAAELGVTTMTIYRDKRELQGNPRPSRAKRVKPDEGYNPEGYDLHLEVALVDENANLVYEDILMYPYTEDEAGQARLVKVIADEADEIGAAVRELWGMLPEDYRRQHPLT